MSRVRDPVKPDATVEPDGTGEPDPALAGTALPVARAVAAGLRAGSSAQGTVPQGVPWPVTPEEPAAPEEVAAPDEPALPEVPALPEELALAEELAPPDEPVSLEVERRAGQALDIRMGSHAEAGLPPAASWSHPEAGLPSAAGSACSADAAAGGAAGAAAGGGGALKAGAERVGRSVTWAGARSSGAAGAGTAGAASAAGAGRAGRSADPDGVSLLLAAISSATRLSAAMMTAGLGLSPSCPDEFNRAPAAAAAERPTCRAAGTGRDGVLVSERQRSSHSSVVPPQPRTYAESTGNSGSPGPTSAARMESYG